MKRIRLLALPAAAILLFTVTTTVMGAPDDPTPGDQGAACANCSPAECLRWSSCVKNCSKSNGCDKSAYESCLKGCNQASECGGPGDAGPVVQ